MPISLWNFAGEQDGNLPQLGRASRILCFVIGRQDTPPPPFQDAWMTPEGHQWLNQQLADDPDYLNHLGIQDPRVQWITERLFADQQELEDYLEQHGFDWAWNEMRNPGRGIRLHWFHEDVGEEPQPDPPLTEEQKRQLIDTNGTVVC